MPLLLSAKNLCQRARAHAGKALAVLALCVLALTVWGSVASYQQRQQHYRHQAERELQTINLLHARSVQQWREQRLSDATALTEDPLLEQALVRWSNTADPAQQALLQARLRILQEQARYTAVYLVSAQGQVLLSAEGPAGGLLLPAPERSALQQALDSAQAHMVEPRTDPLFAFPFASLMAPVFNGSRPLAAVWLVSDARTSLYPLLAHWPTLSETAESNLVGRDGDAVLYYNPLRHSGPAPSLRVPLEQAQDPGSQAVAGVRGVFYGQDYRGETVMAAASAVPGSPWYVVTSIDTTEVFAETRQREMLALSLPVSLGLLCAGLVFAALQRRGWQRERDLKAQVQRNMRWLESAQKTAALGYFAYELPSATFTLSSMAQQIFGVPGASVSLQDWTAMLVSDQRQQVLQEHRSALALRQPLQLQYGICRASDQERRWLQVWGEYEVEERGEVVRVIGSVQDITERKTAEQAMAAYRDTLEVHMRLDPLTHIANRRALDEHVATHWQRAMRSHSALSLLMVDVDHFKQYNDHYGHVEGDACLQRVAGALAQLVARADDLVARFGGEEFAILLPDTDAQQACALAHRVCEAVRSLGLPHASSDTASCVTVSVGVACVYPVFSAAGTLHGSGASGGGSGGRAPEGLQGAGLAQDLFERADAALYLAKQQGRNRVALQPAAAADTSVWH